MADKETKIPASIVLGQDFAAIARLLLEAQKDDPAAQAAIANNKAAFEAMEAGDVSKALKLAGASRDGAALLLGFREIAKKKGMNFDLQIAMTLLDSTRPEGKSLLLQNPGTVLGDLFNVAGQAVRDAFVTPTPEQKQERLVTAVRNMWLKSARRAIAQGAMGAPLATGAAPPARAKAQSPAETVRIFLAAGADINAGAAKDNFPPSKASPPGPQPPKN